MRAEASANVSPASASDAPLGGDVVAAVADCPAASVATRVAAAAAPSTETVNSRRERCDIRGYDTPIRYSGNLIIGQANAAANYARPRVFTVRALRN
jgi:hypothetical protein